MENSQKNTAVIYKFYQKCDGKVIGKMFVKPEIAHSDGWMANGLLSNILVGGIEKGLQFAFPDQGAGQLSSGDRGCEIDSPACLEALLGKPFGSSDGKTIDTGAVIGCVSGFDNNNQLMTLTFEDFGGASHEESATTMYNNAIESDCGLAQECRDDDGNECDDHAKKYIYFGSWKRSDLSS